MPNYVTLVVDLYNGRGALTSEGTAQFVPTYPLTDAPDLMMVTVEPVTAQFSSQGSPMVRLLATDAPGPQPDGWAWQAGFSAPGAPASFSFLLPAGPASFTATDATPAVFTWTPTTELTELPDGTGVQLAGGSLPTGFTAGTTYYVVNSTGSTFELAATQGGSAIASTSTGSGTLTVTQYNLSTLSPVYTATQMQPYLPLGGGTLTGALTGADVSLNDQATVPVNAALGNDFTLLMTAGVGGSRAMGAPSGGRNKQNITFLLVQPGSGGPCTVTWATGAGGYDFGAAGAPTLSTAAGAADLVGFKYVAAVGKWCYLGAGAGYS